MRDVGKRFQTDATSSLGTIRIMARLSGGGVRPASACSAWNRNELAGWAVRSEVNNSL